MTDLKPRKTSVALGNFDGLHKGHLAVINEAVMEKHNGLLPCILTFDSHPQKTLRGSAPKKIMTRSLCEKTAKELGCETVRIPFEEVRNMTPEEFFNEILIKKLHVGFVSCGFNYRFGKNGAGTAEMLKKLCKNAEIGFRCAGEVLYNEEPISSTRIRQAIEKGDIETANNMLGRHFAYDFEVVHGDRIGKKLLGFPTINQIFPEWHIIPKNGVYASATEIDGKLYPSMTNIGKRPTVGGEELRSETCIIGFSGDLYGTHPEVRLLKLIRTEKKFPSLESLSQQLKNDSETAEKIYNEVFR
ncbi:MAG: bifunctional riboflavin kinase/FAD synthetase [Clostridia bacterium]|nr:bifunctional riboflavin kinase/FAD synthetase [Clostridia bacterium]